MSVILDASAVLAFILKESGSETVETVLSTAIISAVNMAEVYAKCADRGLDPDVIKSLLVALPMEIVPFTNAHALEAGRLRLLTRAHGLSLGDRACLATAIAEKSGVLTADRVWLELGLDLDIKSIR
ncbi:MAG: type II toxin-antitoxin system VapC family toxin [Asticcacaulis sp.]